MQAGGSVAAGADVRLDRAVGGRRSIANKVLQSAIGRAATGTMYPPADASLPMSSTHFTRQRSRQLPECGPVTGFAGPCFR